MVTLSVSKDFKMHNRTTRRDLLALAGAALVPPALRAQSQENPATASPDLVVFNARVTTVDPRLPRAEAFAIKNGRFLAVGSTADIRNLARKGTPTWDAKEPPSSPASSTLTTTPREPLSSMKSWLAIRMKSNSSPSKASSKNSAPEPPRPRPEPG